MSAIRLEGEPVAGLEASGTNKAFVFLDSTGGGNGIPSIKYADGTTVPIGTVNTSRQIIAGAGLTGGGDLSADRTINVVANADGSIVVAADDIKVGVVNATQHGVQATQTTALHALATAGGNAGFISGTDQSKLNSITSGAAVASVGGTAPIVSSGGTTPSISITTATTGAAGAMAAADKVFQAAQQAAMIVVTSNAYSNLTFNGATDDLAALNALYNNAPDHSVLLWGPGTMLLSGAATIPGGKHFRHVGAGIEKTYFQSTSQTADTILINDWQNTFEGITFKSTQTTTTGVQTLPTGTINVGSTTNFAASGSFTIATTTGWQTVTYTGGGGGGTTLTGCLGGTGNTSIGGAVIFKTAGYAINGGSNVYIFIKDCSFSGVFNGWLNNATLCGMFNCDFASTINFGMQFNGPNVNAILHNITCDGIPPAVAHVEVNQCGSLLITGCDFIRGLSNLRLNPTSPNGCFGVYAINTYFDSSPGSSVKFLGTGNIQRIKFTNCWLSGSVNGCEFASTAATLPTATDFTNCDIYSNSANGILATAVQDWSIAQSRIAGNVTAGINATAVATHALRLQNNRIGPTGGIGANGTGVILGAGAYASIDVSSNDLAGNTSGAISDAGPSTATAQKRIHDNHGMSVGSIPISAAVATSGTADTIIHQVIIPANGVLVNTTYAIRAYGVTAALGNPTFKVHLGTAGTNADATVCATAAITGSAAAAVMVDFLITVRSIGVGGTVMGNGTTLVGTTVTGTGTAPATAAMNTTVANFLSFSAAMSASTCTFHDAAITVIRQ